MTEIYQEVASLTDSKDKFRDYVGSKRAAIVECHYRDMRTFQSVDYVRRMHEKYSFADGKFRRLLTIKEAFQVLESYVDSSDPDVSLPNIVHMFQTAEGMRKAGIISFS
jgi:inositol oxygenase